MNTGTYLLYQAEQVRAMDQAAIQDHGISGTVLMERAGASAFAALQKQWPQARRIGVICGTGNNGGDGFVVARLAKEAGLNVEVYQVGDAASLKGDALAACQRLQSVDISPEPYAEAKSLSDYEVIIDALLGTGLHGEVREQHAEVIADINQAARPVLALDIPSGLNADTGAVQGVAVKAACTISFVGAKAGLYTGDAPDYCGTLIFDRINVPPAVYQVHSAVAEFIDYDSLKQHLTPRPRITHKGDCGHVLVVGGERGFTGAVRLAAEAAVRIGAGLVSIATRQEHALVLNQTRPELMCYGVTDEAEFQHLAGRADVIVVGPGLGQSAWSQAMLDYALDAGLPLVVDADALNLLSQAPQARQQWVLTPHPGEASRLLGQSSQEIHADRYTAVRQLQQSLGGYVVLKGAGSLIARPDKPTCVCTAGNPGMASGGMGDVLSGIIAGLLAQKLDLEIASCLGVCLHARAGDMAANGAGERGLLASDLMSWIRRLANP